MAKKAAKKKTVTKTAPKTVKSVEVSDEVLADVTEAVEATKPKPKAEKPDLSLANDSRPDHIQRLEHEGAELQEKLEKLNIFLKTPVYQALPDLERHLLQTQKNGMVAYYNALVERINLFAKLK